MKSLPKNPGGHQDVILQGLAQATQHGLRTYKLHTVSLINAKEPLTDTQLTKYHKDIKEEILSTLRATYADLLENPEMCPLVFSSLSKLEQELDMQLIITLKRYEVALSQNLNKLSEFNIVAENTYDDLMEDFVPSQFSRSEVIRKHEEVLRATWSRFESLVQGAGLKLTPDVRITLNFKLEEKLRDLLQECKPDPVTAPPSVLNAAEEYEFMQSLSYSQNTSPHSSLNQELSFQTQPGNGAGPSRSNDVNQPAPLDPFDLDFYTSNGTNLPTGSVRSATFNPNGLVEARSPEGAAANPNKDRQTESIDVGIYFDKLTVTVGTINSQTNALDILMSIPAQIAFLPTGVAIGNEAVSHKDDRNHVHLYDFVSHSIQITLYVGPNSTRLSSENVLRAFFLKLRADLQARTGAGKVSAVFSIPFATTSLERRRIKQAAGVAFEELRILSSLLTTAVAYSAQNLYYLREGTPVPQFVFVAQALRKEFSMAVIEIGPNGIQTTSVVTSRNLRDCSSYDFISGNSNLFQGTPQRETQENKVARIYSSAANQLMRRLRPGILSRTLIIRSSRLLDGILSRLCDHGGSVVKVEDGPLLGACLLAQKQKQIVCTIPPSLQVYDMSRTYVSVHFRRPGQPTNLSDFALNSKDVPALRFRPGLFYDHQATLYDPGHVQFVIEERYNPNAAPIEADTFDLFPDAPNAQKLMVYVQGKTDSDGILSIHVRAESGELTPGWQRIAGGLRQLRLI